LRGEVGDGTAGAELSTKARRENFRGTCHVERVTGKEGRGKSDRIYMIDRMAGMAGMVRSDRGLLRWLR
jgi:hypothetical protein